MRSCAEHAYFIRKSQIEYGNQRTLNGDTNRIFRKDFFKLQFRKWGIIPKYETLDGVSLY